MNVLLVEGFNDKYVVEKLLKRRKIDFDNFEIKECKNIDKLLSILPNTIKLRGNEEVIGIVVDADEDLAERWEVVKRIMRKTGYKDVPHIPNQRGSFLKDENHELPRIGIWLMPNNQLNGNLEDFIRFLVPSNDKILPLAEKTVDHLISEGKNRFILPHRSKAIIHTWLAWQERPGTQLGAAITYRAAKTKEHILEDDMARDFIEWLKRLFR